MTLTESVQTVCVFTSVWSYVGHVENDSRVGH